MPTEPEIAALLALPEGAREALKGCAGPGWAIWHEVKCRIEGGRMFAVENSRPAPKLQASPPTDTPDAARPWLPCNPLEIVRVAAEKVSPEPGAFFQVSHCAGGWEAVAVREEAQGATPHLAALALLGEVWGG